MNYYRGFTDSVLVIVFKNDYSLYNIILLSLLLSELVYLESRISLLLIRPLLIASLENLALLIIPHEFQRII